MHKRSVVAQKTLGLKGKLFAKKRHAEKALMKKTIAMHEERDNKHKAEDGAPQNAVPAYLLEREQVWRHAWRCGYLGRMGSHMGRMGSSRKGPRTSPWAQGAVVRLKRHCSRRLGDTARAEGSGPAPLTTPQVDRAKVLSNTIKQKRKEKAGKWEVPLPKVRRWRSPGGVGLGRCARFGRIGGRGHGHLHQAPQAALRWARSAGLGCWAVGRSTNMPVPPCFAPGAAHRRGRDVQGAQVGKAAEEVVEAHGHQGAWG